MPGQQGPVAVGARQHDRAFNDRYQVTSQRPGVERALGAALPGGGLQVRVDRRMPPVRGGDLGRSDFGGLVDPLGQGDEQVPGLVEGQVEAEDVPCPGIRVLRRRDVVRRDEQLKRAVPA